MNRRNLVGGIGALALAGSIIAGGTYAYKADALSETLVEKEKVISDMKVVKASQDKKIEELGNNLLDVRQENVDLKDNLAKEVSRADSFKSKADSFERDNKELDGRLSTLQNEIRTVKADLREAKKTKPVAAISSSKTHTPQAISSPGNQPNVSKTLTVTATAYTAYCNGCSGVTSTGINLRKNPTAKVIAVDPAVVPIGSKVYLEGYGYAIAADKGGAIKGHKIDVFIPDTAAAKRFGKRTVELKVLR